MPKCEDEVKKKNTFSTLGVRLWNAQNKQKVRIQSSFRNETDPIKKGVRSWRAHSFPRLHPQRGSDPIQKGADININIEGVPKKNALSGNHFCQYSSFTRVSIEERYLPSIDTLVTGMLAKVVV